MQLDGPGEVDGHSPRGTRVVVHQPSKWNGQCFLPQATELDAYTDSSDGHWGLVIDKEIISRSWSDEVVRHLIQHPLTKAKLVNVISDNTTTIAYINKFGGTRSPQLMDLAEKIWS